MIAVEELSRENALARVDIVDELAQVYTSEPENAIIYMTDLYIYKSKRKDLAEVFLSPYLRRSALGPIPNYEEKRAEIGLAVRVI